MKSIGYQEYLANKAKLAQSKRKKFEAIQFVTCISAVVFIFIFAMKVGM